MPRRTELKPTPIPRVIQQGDRLPPGATSRRFKVSCANYYPQTARYILARDREQAGTEYLRVSGLAALMQQARERGETDAEEPALTIVELAD